VENDWWFEWEDHPLSFCADLYLETTESDGTVLNFNVSLYTTAMDPLFSAGFARTYKRPRPWVLNLSLPRGPWKWQWREQSS
jgi:hypothetical protein